VSEALRAELIRVASRLGADGIDFVLERPRDAGHGDLATNLAMVLAKRERTNPRQTAERVLQEIHLPPELIQKTEIAGPGFINFWLAGHQLAAVHQRILTEGASYGRSSAGQGLSVNVEFVSANPTGPLHVGHGRQAALGDAIAALLDWTGHRVTREFYYNDAGVQIANLAASVQARVREALGEPLVLPEGGYHGEYIKEIAATYRREFSTDPHADDLDQVRRLAIRELRREQDLDLKALGMTTERSMQWWGHSLGGGRRMRTKAHSGCGPLPSGTTRIVSCGSPTAPSPTSCRMWRTTSTSGSAGFGRLSTCRGPTTTAL
jgi:arginyl-tRNA synthetase